MAACRWSSAADVARIILVRGNYHPTASDSESWGLGTIHTAARIHVDINSPFPRTPKVHATKELR